MPVESFKALINDVNHYKNTAENMKMELGKYACEIANLKQENKTLEESSINLESTLHNCLLLLNKIDFSKSNLKKDYSALLENEWIKNHKTGRSENKLEAYKSYGNSKQAVKGDSTNCQNISTGNEKPSLTLSSGNEANEISSTNFKSPCKEFRNLKEDLLPNQDSKNLSHSFLNIDNFKIKNWDSAFDNIGEDVFHSREDLMSSFAMEEDEDDVIFESPKLTESTATKKKRVQAVGEPKTLFLAPNSVECQNKDLDETYISTPIIQYHQLEAQKTFKAKERNNQKQSNREKSPEYDSVPFYYKRSSVRKKTDRMKLLGHTCPDCDQYYKNVFGCKLTAKNFREMLNKCSRHRDKNSQSIDNTPPGYWKPYLTASVISQKAEDNS